MQFMKSRNLWTVVPTSESIAKTGKPPVSVRWVDTNKGTAECPNYRSRLVGREIKKDNRVDLFSATPPLEAMKALISICADDPQKKKRLAVVDVKRFFFYATDCNLN